MRKINLFFLLIVAVVFFQGCKTDVNVPSNDPDIHYNGRIDMSGNAARMFWSGSSAAITFEGSSVYVTLKDERGDNYFNVIIDNDSIFMLHPDSSKCKYKLAENLGKGKHTVEIFKRTEWTNGHTDLYGFEILDGAKLLPAPDEKRLKLEFYGNSITAGYAVEDTTGKDRPDSIYTNNYNSYDAVTARLLNADFNCICRSGIGIMLSWFPMIMPEMYYRLDPANPDSKWDFSLYTPDVIVINLLQNDSWLVNKPDFPEFKHRFGTTPPSEDFIINAYKDFVSSIRLEYPSAKIICMLGNMDITREGSPWSGYVQKAVDELGDKNIHTLFVPFKGTPGHPNVKEQRSMAETLAGFIKNIR